MRSFFRCLICALCGHGSPGKWLRVPRAGQPKRQCSRCKTWRRERLSMNESSQRLPM
jgi:hypothetical protein